MKDIYNGIYTCFMGIIGPDPLGQDEGVQKPPKKKYVIDPQWEKYANLDNQPIDLDKIDINEIPEIVAEEIEIEEEKVENDNPELLSVILGHESGIPYVKFTILGKDGGADVQITSGFCTAISQFSLEVFKSRLTSMRTEDAHCVILDTVEPLRSMMTTHNHTRMVPEPEDQLRILNNQYIRKFYEMYNNIFLSNGSPDLSLFDGFPKVAVETYMDYSRMLQEQFNVELYDEIKKLKLTPDLKSEVESLKTGRSGPNFREQVYKLLLTYPPIIDELDNKLKDPSKKQISEMFQLKIVNYEAVRYVNETFKKSGGKYRTLKEWGAVIQNYYFKTLADKILEYNDPNLTDAGKMYFELLSGGNEDLRKEADDLFRKMILGYGNVFQTAKKLYNQFEDIAPLVGVKLLAP
jgi:hypothetical protein